LPPERVRSRHYAQEHFENLVLVSPDVGNVKRARIYARRLGGDLAIIDKRRTSGTDVEVGRIIGDVKDCTVLMMDDMISTAGTVCMAAELCMDKGAKCVYVGATHAVLAGPAAERLRNAPIEQVLVTDTIPVDAATVSSIGKLVVLGTAELIGEAIHRIHHDESVSSLFLKDVGQ